MKATAANRNRADLPADGDVEGDGDDAQPVFRHLPAPTATELVPLVQQIAGRIGRVLEQRGLIERDMENWLCWGPANLSAM